MFYREVQPLLKNRVLLVFFVPLPFLVLLLGYGAINQIVFDQAFGAQPASSFFILFVLTILIILLYIFIQLKLVTEVDSDGVSVKFNPWQMFATRILLTEIKHVEITSYDAITDHGGWGWRNGSFGRAFTAYGSQTVRITVNGGRHIFIGTQSPHDLAASIKDAFALRDRTRQVSGSL